MKYQVQFQATLNKMNEVNSDMVPANKRPFLALISAIEQAGGSVRTAGYDEPVVVTKEQKKQYMDLMEQFEDGEIPSKPKKSEFATPFAAIAAEYGVTDYSFI